MNGSLSSQPIRLTNEERRDLYGVFNEFFTCFNLQDMREMLWHWFVAAISSDSGAYATGHGRSNLIFVYEKLQGLIEAAHELNKRKKKKERRKHRKRAAAPGI